MNALEEYKKELTEMLFDCSNWDSQTNALIEAFDRGIDFQKKQVTK